MYSEFSMNKLFNNIQKEVTVVCLLNCFSRVQLFVNPRTVAHQALLSMDSLGKTPRVGCHTLLQGIFPTQGLNPCLSCISR